MIDIRILIDKKIGFAGGGMMAEAIIARLLADDIPPENLLVFDSADARRRHFLQQYGIQSAAGNDEIARAADIIILAVKPNIVPDVLSDIGDIAGPHQLIISIAAGVTTSTIEAQLSVPVPVIRVMPNTPALVGMGASAIAPGKYAAVEHIGIATQIFRAVGKTIEVPEDKMDAVTGLSGSGPAYVYMFIDAMADGGVRMGLPKATALLLAAQTVAGAAMMVLESDDHPAVLKDRVTTPGGTTIEGIAVLERNGFRNSCIEAITAAANRSAELGKK